MPNHADMIDPSGLSKPGFLHGSKIGFFYFRRANFREAYRCKGWGIILAFIEPGKPMQNTYVEWREGSMRRERLDAWVFRTIDEMRE
ncbi:integrase core domain-containing protein [Rhodocaloribacter sp.]